MKFSCKTQELLSALHLVSRAIGGEQTLPILQNVLIHVEGKRCTLSATNLELSIVTSFEVNIENEGGITVPAKAILNFIQYNRDEEVLLETSEGTQVKVHSKHAKAVIAGEATSGYPVITSIQKETALTIPVGPLINALNLVTFACAKTTSRPVISGVYVRAEKGKIILVGTDSYRLSEYKIPVAGIAGEVACIIPARFLEELKAVVSAKRGDDEKAAKTDKAEKTEKKTKEVETLDINMSAQQIEVQYGHTKLTSRLIDGKFPDYVQVLPKEKHTTVTVPVRELLSAAKRMHYFAKEVNNNITFAISKSALHLSTKQTQLGKDESTIDAQVDGIENKIAISSNYMIDFLSRIGDDQLAIEVSDKMHPAVFKLPGNEDYLHLIMPLRMAED
ncbi:MAG TPA: DNA polymerase III subunit beta [Zoogloea sp.]|nr:DNA polymerase III subunit beta [Zoogloea sp.]